MQLHSYVEQVQAHLAAAAALGDERTRHTADALAAAAEPAMRLAVLGAVSAAADEITAALLDSPGTPAVSVRIDGDDLRIEVRAGEPEPDATPPPADDADASARISLRLSEALKAEIESAARTESISVNTWLVRAAAGALSLAAGAARRAPNSRDNRRHGGSGTHHITGWVNG